MSKEEKQAIKQVSQLTWGVYCDMLNKTGGDMALALNLTGIALKAIMQPQPQQPTGGATYFMGEWGNDNSD